MTPSQSTGRGSARQEKYLAPTVWSQFAALTLKYQSVNLGQGFPSWSPAEFLLQSLSKHMANGPHQYQRSMGNGRLVNSVAKVYSKLFGRQLDGLTNVCVTIGAVQALHSTIVGLVNEGEEVVLFEPSYDCYRAQVNMAGGVVRSIPLISRRKNSQKEITERSSLEFCEEKDSWDLDFQALAAAVNEKTKIILINTPHNPTGKIFTKSELQKIYDIIKPFPRIIVVEDAVYEHLPLSEYNPLHHPRFANLSDDAWNRTVSLSSAGKLFSATGVRVGWAIGPADLIQNGPISESIADALEASDAGNGYFEDVVKMAREHRDLLARQLINSTIPFKLWIPQGGLFMIADVSDVNVPASYFTEELSGKQLTRDVAFSQWLLKEKGVTSIPCSFLYPPEMSHLGENLVRFAFCKSKEEIIEAGKRLSQ